MSTAICRCHTSILVIVDVAREGNDDGKIANGSRTSLFRKLLVTDTVLNIMAIILRYYRAPASLLSTPVIAGILVVNGLVLFCWHIFSRR